MRAPGQESWERVYRANRWSRLGLVASLSLDGLAGATGIIGALTGVLSLTGIYPPASHIVSGPAALGGVAAASLLAYWGWQRFRIVWRDLGRAPEVYEGELESSERRRVSGSHGGWSELVIRSGGQHWSIAVAPPAVSALKAPQRIRVRYRAGSRTVVELWRARTKAKR